MKPIFVMARAGSGGGGGGGGGYNAETLAWIAGISGLGGSVTTQEKDWADALIVALQGETYNAKVVWMAPFIGSNIKAARMPLRDALSVGAMSSFGSSPFVDADCGNSTGIQNPTEKDAYLGTGVPLNWNLANGYKSGYGWWELNIGFGSNVEPMGAYNAANGARFVLDLRSSFERFRYGNTTGSQAGPATSASNGHYYGQYDGTDTRIYLDGSDLGSPGASGFADSIDNNEIFVMGCNSGTDTPWKGQGGCAYITDGTMTSGEIAAFHTLLDTYLITPTGR